MFVRIVLTALILDTIFAVAGIIPEGRKAVSEITQFKLDYTFWLNLVSGAVVFTMLFFQRKYRQKQGGEHDHDMDHSSGVSIKRLIAYLFAMILLVGLVAFFLTSRIV